MGLFKKLLGMEADNLRLDPAVGDAEAAALYESLAAGQFDAARSALAQATDHGRREFIANVLAEHPGRPNVFDAWCEQHPDDPNAHIVSGRNAIKWAWEARGTGVASTVGQSAAQTYFQRLELAGQLLDQSARLAPDDPLPHAFMIEVDKGLSGELDVSTARFQKVIQRSPDHWAAHTTLHSRYCEKWGGSHDMMFTLSRERVAAAEGSPHLPGLLALSHIERWVYANMDDDESGLIATYFTDDAIRDELADAFAKMTQASEPTVHTAMAANHFAFCFDMLGDPAHAAKAFALIGDRVTEYPWAFTGDPIKEFRKARSRATG